MPSSTATKPSHDDEPLCFEEKECTPPLSQFQALRQENPQSAMILQHLAQDISEQFEQLSAKTTALRTALDPIRALLSWLFKSLGMDKLAAHPNLQSTQSVMAKLAPPTSGLKASFSP
jgi:hypothetical protein